MGIALVHGQCLVAQQVLQYPRVHAAHDQMRGVGVPQIVEPEVRDARLPASRSEAVLNVLDVPAVPIPENIACLLPHIPEVDGSNLIVPVPVLGYINH